MISIVAALIGTGGGLAIGFKGSQHRFKQRQEETDKQIKKAKQEADKILNEARKEAREALDKAAAEEEERRAATKQHTDRLEKREKKLDEKQEALEKRQEELKQREAEVDKAKQVVYEIREQQEDKLQKISKLTKKEAAEKLHQMVERDIRADLQGLIAKLQNDAKAQAEDSARAILIGAMERIASETVAERTITSVKIDNEDIKGRIIGKEGRNIQALQKATGVDILVDDAPGVIVLSCFDPIRREVARQTLEMLIKDGRIHPARIEELLAKAQKQVQKEVVKAAEDAAREVGIVGIPPAILQLLGELRFRTSYGQNVLKHSIEMANIAGVLAEQIGADVHVCKYAALVHDLGKALTHKMEGKHHHLSGEMLRKYGVAEAVAHAAEAHHDDVEATTIEAVVIRVVDAVSAARPGARNISAENFVERMKTLENIANGFKGIEKSYAISAGREVRVFVKPGDLDDLQSIQMARDIALKIESMMNYPGTIKVTVIRETRAIEYAK
ncbi:ribonuclease Y [Candidatus Saccharibacteria bacterium]|nr:ribonuclease Y [Candidatus Saccharibacteria bacterium]